MTNPLKTSEECYRDPYIHTQRGVFRLDAPTFNIPAMAHALGQLARFNGHADLFYSVAEHSVLVSLLMEELNLGDPMEGLLHDGQEAFLSDVPSPFKHRLPDYCAVEAKLEAEMRAHFGLAEHKTEGCKRADWLALFIEAYQIVQGKGLDFADPHGLRQEALRLRERGWMVRGLEWRHAAGVFQMRYDELNKDIKRSAYGQ
jgi:uncharacterized protein